jgi:hypothetical protein
VIQAAVQYRIQYGAQLRLQLYTVMRTTEAFQRAADTARALLGKAADANGMVSDLAVGAIRPKIAAAVDEALAEWQRLLIAARRESASIPFGTMRVMHRLAMRGRSRQRFGEAVRGTLDDPEEDESIDYVFQPQIAVVLNAATRNYRGGFSDAIWRTSQHARAGVNGMLYQGISQGKSAWDIARMIEGFLGPGGDCPRWTRTRLFSLTKKDIAGGNMTGLLSASPITQAMGAQPCQPKGVSYSALRAARSEIARVQHAASQQTYRDQPWVQKEQINLNPQHPEEDICDEIIAAGEGGKGVYPIGEISLPIHPNCLCYSTAVMMDDEEFEARMAEWERGGSWPDMDAYAARYGAGMEPPIAPLTGGSAPTGPALDLPEGVRAIDALSAWTEGGEDELDTRMGYNG